MLMCMASVLAQEILPLPANLIRLSPPADGADAATALRDAIAQAQALGPGARVELDAGRFIIESFADENWSIVIGNAHQFTLAGQGPETEIIFRDPRRGGIFVAGGSGVIVRDLTVDYDPPPFTQGTIVAVDLDAGTFDLRVDEGYPSPDAPWFATGDPPRNMAVAFDAHQRRLKAGAPDFYIVGGWQAHPATPNVWTIRLCDDERNKTSSLSPGDRFALLSRRGNGAFRFNGTVDSTLENVTVHASPSLTVALAACSDMTIRNLRVTYRAGSDRLIASTGDGLHVQQNRVGPIIQNCLFEGLCDDAVNIYAPPMIVRRVLSPSEVEVTASADVRIGDTLQIFDPRAGIVRAEPKVLAVRDVRDLRAMTFDHPVDNIVAGEDHRSADTIYNLSACGAGYVITGNHMRNHRRFGLLLRAGGGVISDNTFENLGGWSICIGNEPSWPEGPAGADWLIRGNRFIAGAYSAGYGDSPFSASIVIQGMSLAGIPPTPLLSSVRIEDNHFTASPGGAVALRSVRNVVLRRNRTAEGNPPRVITEHVEEVINED